MSEQRPGMRGTNAGDLAVSLVIVGVAVYVLLRFSYDSIPRLQYLVALPIAALALIEFVAAGRVRGAVRHDPHARPMTAIAIARCVALGKASALVGAGVLGASFGVLGRTIPDAGDLDAAAHDTRVAAVLAVASLLLGAAGLVLERAGIDPGSDERRTRD